MLLPFRQIHRRTMHSLNFQKMFHLVFTLQVLLFFPHSIIPVASLRRSVAQVSSDDHRGQINSIIRTNLTLGLNSITTIKISSVNNNNNNNITKSNYINLDLKEKLRGESNRKIVAHRPLLITSHQQAPFFAPFIWPSVATRTSSSVNVANKSFLPSKMPPQTATANLSTTNRYTNVEINGLNVDGAIICDCSINAIPISNDKRRREVSTQCEYQCLSAVHRHRRNVRQFPGTLVRLSSTASNTIPNVMVNQRRQWQAIPTATFTELSFMQLSIVDLFLLFPFTNMRLSFDRGGKTIETMVIGKRIRFRFYSNL